MDELKISSKLMRMMVSKLLSKVVQKKLGYKIDIKLSGLEVTVTDQVAHVHIDANADMDTKELKKFEQIIENADF